MEISKFVWWKYKSPCETHNFLNPSLDYLGTKPRVRFCKSRSCLKKTKITYDHGKIVNIYIAYEENKNNNKGNNDPTPENCLFGAVSLTKNANIDRYKYSWYETGFDRLYLTHNLVEELEEM